MVWIARLLSVPLACYRCWHGFSTSTMFLQREGHGLLPPFYLRPPLQFWSAPPYTVTTGLASKRLFWWRMTAPLDIGQHENAHPVLMLVPPSSMLMGAL